MPYQPYQSTWQNPYLPAYNQGQPVAPMVQPYQQPVNGVIKVNGRDSAMQYQLPPNSMSPALFDNDGKVFYRYGSFSDVACAQAQLLRALHLPCVSYRATTC